MKQTRNTNWTIVSNGNHYNVPKNIKNEYEKISIYGINAVIERFKRTRAYKHIYNNHGIVQIDCLISPSGKEITQF
jgi:hypothetical protein